MAAPTRKKTITPTLQVSRFFVNWFATFFERTCPASSIANPACIKKIRNVTVSTQIILTPSTTAPRSDCSRVFSIRSSSTLVQKCGLDSRTLFVLFQADSLFESWIIIPIQVIITITVYILK